MVDTPFNRGTLESIVEAGNYGQGAVAYWLEVREGEAEKAAQPAAIEHPARRWSSSDATARQPGVWPPDRQEEDPSA